MDLGRIFEKGQGETQIQIIAQSHLIRAIPSAYVALSRATNMQTLEVLNFHPSKWVLSIMLGDIILTCLRRVMAHPRVLHWHKNFEQDDVCFDDDFDDEMDNYEAMANYHGD